MYCDTCSVVVFSLLNYCPLCWNLVYGICCDIVCEKYSIFTYSENFIRLFVGHLILCILWVGQSTNLRSDEIPIHFSNIAYSLKSTNSSVHEHVQCLQTTKFRADELEWFHSIKHRYLSLSTGRKGRIPNVLTGCPLARQGFSLFHQQH